MRPVVFIDTSVLIAGLKSITGQSHKLLYLCSTRKITGCVSQKVVEELNSKLEKIGVDKEMADTLIVNASLIVLPRPKNKLPHYISKIVDDPKDHHLLASALQVKNSILITLDKKHLLNIASKISHPKIMSPAEFLTLF